MSRIAVNVCCDERRKARRRRESALDDGQAGPATPVAVFGLATPPEAGDRLHVVDEIEIAREIAEARDERARAAGFAVRQRLTLENLAERIAAG